MKAKITPSERNPIEPDKISPPEVVVSTHPTNNANYVKHEMESPPMPMPMDSDNNGANYQQLADKLVGTLKEQLEESLKSRQSNNSNTSSDAQLITSVVDQIKELSLKIGNQTDILSSVQKLMWELQTNAGAVPKKSGGTESSTTEAQTVFSRPFELTHPLTSSIFCHGNDTVSRVCTFKNLCYDPAADRFIVFKDDRTLELNVPRNRSYLLDTTSIDGHNKFYFDYGEVHPDSFPHKNIYMVDKRSFLFSRFHALNIMHTMHDDFMGLYMMHRIFAPNFGVNPKFPFERDNNIVTLDQYPNLRYDYIFQLLSERPLQHKATWIKKLDKPICFREAIVGNSKVTAWYDYGFLIPQGPLNKTVDGLLVRDAAQYIMERLEFPTWDTVFVKGILEDLMADKQKHYVEKLPRRKWNTQRSDKAFIAFFTRKLDRLIINENEVIEALERTFGLQVKTVRMEDMHIGEQISILRNCVIALGVHGSALILGMFLPPGAIMIELFPYAVPTENYTPYKTMCNIPGMRLTYRSWTNKKAENNFPHPEKSAQKGGINHLSEVEQEKIKNSLTIPKHLCCHDPYWLYRIYQDTIVDIPELVETIEDALEDAVKMVKTEAKEYVFKRPGMIEKVRCRAIIPQGIDPKSYDADTMLDVEVSWDLPWNGAHPTQYGIWIHQAYKEFFSKEQSLVHNCRFNSTLDIWVRSYTGTGDELIRSQYTDKHTCPCTPDTVAKLIK